MLKYGPSYEDGELSKDCGGCSTWYLTLYKGLAFMAASYVVACMALFSRRHCIVIQGLKFLVTINRLVDKISNRISQIDTYWVLDFGPMIQIMKILWGIFSCMVYLFAANLAGLMR
ncbi:hypothetical protein F5Y15DRAFT_354940 [Xylariaceae sp. FL0016]|nr:hypothetical protein F5Y15DRAFT_354940 [Xylariaceae sp. FL0016]